MRPPGGASPALTTRPSSPLRTPKDSSPPLVHRRRHHRDAPENPTRRREPPIAHAHGRETETCVATSSPASRTRTRTRRDLPEPKGRALPPCRAPGARRVRQARATPRRPRALATSQPPPPVISRQVRVAIAPLGGLNSCPHHRRFPGRGNALPVIMAPFDQPRPPAFLTDLRRKKGDAARRARSLAHYHRQQIHHVLAQPQLGRPLPCPVRAGAMLVYTGTYPSVALRDATRAKIIEAFCSTPELEDGQWWLGSGFILRSANAIPHLFS